MPAGERKNTAKPTPVSTVEQINAQYGKLPPQALDVEEIVLGTLMLESNAYENISSIIKTESFYKDEHKKIFEAVKSLAIRERPVDLLTVTQELKNRNLLDEVGGAPYLVHLTSRVAAGAHLDFHAKIIAQKFIQRELIRVSSEIQAEAYDDTKDIDDLIDMSEQKLFAVAEGNIERQTRPISDVLKDATKQIEEASKQEGLNGVPSGFTRLDQITSGWQRSDLIIVAARPAMGKTAFVLSMARNMAINNKRPVALFSLEMSSVQLVNRLVVAETELPATRIKTGKLAQHEWELFLSRTKVFETAPIYIDDTPALSVFEFRAKCRRLKAKYNIEAVIVDYLQLMTAGADSPRSFGSREQEVSLISRTLKAIAKELNIPVIALSQLSRASESNDGKRPQLSNLRESGAIEQDADIVLFIHRPEYYNITQDQQGNSLIGIAEIIIAKHRNGSVADIQLSFKKELVKFTNLEADMPTSELDGASSMTYSSKMNADNDSSLLGAMPVNHDFDTFTSGNDEPIPF
ncbi:MAG: replicative DNA helicase [Bacteroidales bacterium]|jgi:replicative DNA helicase|nr:replicative DNA helicase [Bacteroidales bacterium]